MDRGTQLQAAGMSKDNKPEQPLENTAGTSDPADAGHATFSRLTAARHLLHRRRLEESLQLQAQPSLRNATLAGLQAAFTLAVAVPLVALSPWSHLVGFASLGALVALFGRFAPLRRRSGIVLQCAFWQTFAVLVMSLAAWLGWPHTGKLLLLAFSCGLYLIVSFRGNFGPPGPLIFIFAVGAALTDSLSRAQVVERSAAVGITALFAWLICVISERLRQPPSPELATPVPLPTRELLLMAARVTVAALIVVLVCQAAGLNYPAWAAMGAVAVMQGHTCISVCIERCSAWQVPWWAPRLPGCCWLRSHRCGLLSLHWYYCSF